MKLDINKLPYLPDFSRIINTMVEVVETNVSETEPSEYLDFLKELEIIVEVNGVYRYGDDWEFLYKADTDGIKSGLRGKLEEIKDLLDIVRFVGTNGKSYDDIAQGMNNRFTEQTIRVVLSWMEYLNVLKIENGRYYYNDSIEENDDEAEERNSDELDEIDVKDAHYSFFDYLRKISEGQIILNPDFQRNKVWKSVQKSQFIESAILGLPLPPVYFKRNAMSKLVIVDGLQRSTAIQEFMENKLRLEGLETLSKLNGLTYGELKESSIYRGYAARLEDNQLYCFILQKTVPMSVVYDIFNRINTGGTKLSRQEIRNCLFIGNSTRLVKKLSENPVFRNAIDNGISKDRMKDREAVLRCLAFRVLDYNKDYLWSMDSFLEKAMKELNRMSEIEIQDIESEFVTIMKRLTEIFGNKNFRIYNDYTRGRINIAVMETVYWCMRQAVKKHHNMAKDVLRERYEEMINDKAYQFNVRNSTGSKSKVFDRFRIAKSYMIPEL